AASLGHETKLTEFLFCSTQCIHALLPNKAERVRLSECKAHSPEHQWSWDGTASAVVNQHTRECLTISDAEELAIAQLAPCEEEGALQAWSCSKKGHLTLQGRGLHLSAKPGGYSAFLSRDKDRFGKWKTDTGSTIYKTVGSLEIHNPSVKATTFLMIHLESQSYVTSGLPMSNERHHEADNGEKKQLALKSWQMSCEEHQPSPRMVSPTSKMQAIPASPSPSLKHGEILIEWKDGTTTSLFDHLY
ncbi:hypothetical protein E2320_017898, partial [Naja naja]